MPRTKEQPTARAVEEANTPQEEARQEAAPAPAAPELSLRVRHSGGMVRLGRVTGTLGALRKRIEAEVKGKLRTASYRDGSMKTVTLLTDGNWPAGGSLMIGPELPARMIFEGDETINVSLASDASKAARANKKRAAAKSSSSPGCKRARAAASVEELASAFVNQVAPESLADTGTAMFTTQQGALRVEAARKQLVRVAKRAPKTADLAFRRAAKAKETLDQIRLLTPDECIDLVAAILDRQAGSKRRRQSRDAPSTRLLTLDAVATRSPDLFWSLYVHSLPQDHQKTDQESGGDVPYMLEHVLHQATQRFKDNQAANHGGGPAQVADSVAVARDADDDDDADDHDDQDGDDDDD